MKHALLLAAIILFAVGIASAEVPKLISYQGRFSDAGTPIADGNYPVTFTIYDQPTDGTVRWTETQSVTITGGLFSVLLGTVNAVDPSVFSGAIRFLGVKLGDNAEMTPRQPLVTVAYAFTADSARTVGDKYVRLSGDTMSGPLEMNGDGGVAVARLSTEVGRIGKIELMNDGHAQVEIKANASAGSITLTDSLGRDEVSLFGNGNGGQLRLGDATGSPKIILDGSGSGNVILPTNSIDAADIKDEPGIASIQSTVTATLTSSVADILTVTINIPSDGYISVTGRGTAYLSGTTGINYGYVQIDETAGGAVAAPYYAVFGGSAMWTTSSTYWPFVVTRVYSKASSGSYTFRLEGRTSGTQGSGAVIEIRNTMLEAIFIPTAY